MHRLILSIAASALLVLMPPAIAQGNIFLTPNSRDAPGSNAGEESKPKRPSIFLNKNRNTQSRRERASPEPVMRPQSRNKAELYARLYAPHRMGKRDYDFERALERYRSQSPATIQFDFAGYEARYKDALTLDPAVMRADGRAARNAEEMRKRAMLMRAPQTIAVIEQRQKNAQYVAALMQKTTKEMARLHEEEKRAYEKRVAERERRERSSSSVRRTNAQSSRPKIFISPSPGRSRSKPGVFTNY